MPDSWRFYRFDYAQYLELRPALRSATTPAAFAALADSPETDAITEAVESGEITIEAARHGWLIAVCCVGEGLLLEGGFPRLVAALGRRRGAEDAAERLAELAAGGKNLEAWLQPSFGLTGFLTPQETAALATDYARLTASGRLRSGKKRKTRRGGLVGFVRNFFRRLLDAGLPAEELAPLIGELLTEAARKGEGVAVVSG